MFVCLFILTGFIIILIFTLLSLPPTLIRHLLPPGALGWLVRRTLFSTEYGREIPANSVSGVGRTHELDVAQQDDTYNPFLRFAGTCFAFFPRSKMKLTTVQNTEAATLLSSFSFEGYRSKGADSSFNQLIYQMWCAAFASTFCSTSSFVYN